jgi:hypothetical protein
VKYFETIAFLWHFIFQNILCIFANLAKDAKKILIKPTHYFSFHILPLANIFETKNHQIQKSCKK